MTEPSAAWRAYRIAPRGDVESPQRPLTGPIWVSDGVPADGWHRARCWADGDRHPDPPVPGCCGVTSTTHPDAMAALLRWVGPLLGPGYRQAGLLRGLPSWVDSQAIAEVDVHGRVVNAMEIDFDASAAVKLHRVHVSAAQARQGDRIAGFYGVPVTVGRHSGVEWITEVCGPYDDSGSWCITCGADAVDGACDDHSATARVLPVRL